MDLRNKTVMILGGSGLVGHAVARRLLEAEPRRLVLVSLYEDEVRDAAAALDSYRGRAEIVVEWGDVFLPATVARLDRATLLADAGHRDLVIQDLFGDLTDDVLERSLLFQLLTKHKPDAVVDSINTATAFAYQDVFHSARDLLARAAAGDLERAVVEQHVLTLTMPQLIRHVQIMLEGLRRADTKAYIKVGTSGTGGMGFNIPYTHSEERPSRTLMTKSAVAGAHSLLLLLMGRTPGAPATIEVKPTATIAWREIGFGPVKRKGKPIPLVDCPAAVPVAEAFSPGAAGWRDLGKPLEGVYINVGENGLFSRDEFETVTTLGSMEFITPEEVADYVVMELAGRPTGRDIIAALDASTAGPTYRAGILRAHAVERLRALERQSGSRAVAYEMLGPPRLSKLLYEAHLCSLLRRTVRALAGSTAAALAAEAHTLLERDVRLRSQILSVGLPIVAPDGRRIYRGSTVVVPPDPADPLAAASRGWVDLRPEQFGVWIRRAGEMVRQAESRRDLSAESGSDVAWTAIGVEEPIEPARFATWVFAHEDHGERIKR
ncbi:MAG: short-chain dehydrogenase [Gemmatimonadetes bacterium]|nr:short-chain dehydrogenase [Gemmatimonadota bacterium]